MGNVLRNHGGGDRRGTCLSNHQFMSALAAVSPGSSWTKETLCRRPIIRAKPHRMSFTLQVLSRGPVQMVLIRQSVDFS
jgi:hypothetical protein